MLCCRDVKYCKKKKKKEKEFALIFISFVTA